MTLSPTISLHNTLLVPSFSHKLLYASQISIDLNCVVLIYPTFCLLQDILTKEIIGHGTKSGDSTTWMILVWVKHIMCITILTSKNNIFGFNIAGRDIQKFWIHETFVPRFVHKHANF